MASQSEPEPIARVPLARSIPRLVALPTLVVLATGAVVIGSLFLLDGVGAAARLFLAGAGSLLAAAGIAAGVVLLSVRLDVEEAALRLHWIGGERRYLLSRGAVTRVAVRGPNASSLRASVGVLGWGLGRGALRGEEPVEVIALGPTDSVILVPTERTRVAIAPRDEAALLDALTRAAQARRRLDELARAAEEPPPAEPPVAAEPPPRRELTGIERAMLEEQLRAEREAAPSGHVPAPATPAEVTPVEHVADAAPGPPVEEESATEPKAPPADRVEPAPLPRPRRRLALPGTPGLGMTAALVAVPPALAGAGWLAIGLDWLPAPSGDEYRLTALALVLGGPGTAIGAVMARIWWPRLVGVIVTCGLLALLVAGRGLISN